MNEEKWKSDDLPETTGPTILCRIGYHHWGPWKKIYGRMMIRHCNKCGDRTIKDFHVDENAGMYDFPKKVGEINPPPKKP